MSGPPSVQGNRTLSRPLQSPLCHVRGRIHGGEHVDVLGLLCS